MAEEETATVNTEQEVETATDLALKRIEELESKIAEIQKENERLNGENKSLMLAKLKNSEEPQPEKSEEELRNERVKTLMKRFE